MPFQKINLDSKLIFRLILTKLRWAFKWQKLISIIFIDMGKFSFRLVCNERTKVVADWLEWLEPIL